MNNAMLTVDLLPSGNLGYYVPDPAGIHRVGETAYGKLMPTEPTVLVIEDEDGYRCGCVEYRRTDGHCRHVQAVEVDSRQLAKLYPSLEVAR